MVPSPLTPRWQSNFCTDALAVIFDLEYWDCSSIVSVPFEATTILDRQYVKTIESVTRLKEELSLLPKDTVCVSHIHCDAPENYEIHEIISSFFKDRVYINFWASAISANMNLRSKEVDTFDKKNALNLKPKIVNILNNYLPCFLFIYMFVRHRKDGGLLQWQNSRKCVKMESLYRHYRVSTIPGSNFFINHPDYEKYLTIEQAKPSPLLRGRYVVYIDQYFPIHPHLQVENPHIDCRVLAQEYYSSVNKFFDKLEYENDCEVVIAGHPVANYSVNPFNNRKIIYFKTAELVRDCIGVCMHTSYSISFMMLYNKPICLMTNSAFMKIPSKKQELNNYSQTFELPIIDIDKVDSTNDIFTTINSDIRTGFMSRFFDASNKKTNSELITDSIVRIHNRILHKNKDDNSSYS